MNLSKNDIEKMSYTDFVGLINQWNVPPGSYDTLNRWCLYSNLSSKSELLEIACTTGFSSRELSIISGCSSLGIDISESSIKSAKNSANKIAESGLLAYEVADAVSYKSDKIFTHIVIGASLGFFNEPQELLNNIKLIMKDNGYLLASPFYVTKEIPQSLIEKAKNIFDITITTQGYKDIMSMYKDFEIHYSEKKTIDKETDDELHHYCSSVINSFKENNPRLSEDIYKACYDRLMDIKIMSNELRPFQNYVVLVLRHVKDRDTKRFIELF
jgi:SAM-dependent methyltransferase